MINVKITTAAPNWPIIEQSPNSAGIWNNCKFFVNQSVKRVDWWVVFDNMAKKERVICPPENTIFVGAETEYIKKYDQKFLNQFGTVVTCQRNMEHPHKIYTQQAHLWHIIGQFGKAKDGVFVRGKFLPAYDELKSMKTIPKTKLMSVVAANKTYTEGQRLRREFINKMKEHFGDRLDVYGTGINPVMDKWDGIAPYKYYLAIENSSVPHYWTTVLADAYLAGAYPLYYGDPNIHDYFSKDALTVIDIHDIEGSVKTIEKIISENHFEKHLADIWEARRLVMDTYNIFPLIADLVNRLPASNDYKPTTLKPQPKPWLKWKITGILRKHKKLYRVVRKIKHFRASDKIR